MAAASGNISFDVDISHSATDELSENRTTSLSPQTSARHQSSLPSQQRLKRVLTEEINDKKDDAVPLLGVSPARITVFDPHDARVVLNHISNYFPLSSPPISSQGQVTGITGAGIGEAGCPSIAVGGVSSSEGATVNFIHGQLSRCHSLNFFLLEPETNYYLHIFLCSINCYEQRQMALDEATTWLETIHLQQQNFQAVGQQDEVPVDITHTGKNKAHIAHTATLVGNAGQGFNTCSSTSLKHSGGSADTKGSSSWEVPGTASTRRAQRFGSMKKPSHPVTFTEFQFRGVILRNYLILLFHPLLLSQPDAQVMHTTKGKASILGNLFKGTSSSSFYTRKKRHSNDRGKVKAVSMDKYQQQIRYSPDFSIDATSNVEMSSVKRTGTANLVGLHAHLGLPPSKAFRSFIEGAKRRLTEFERSFNRKVNFAGRVFRFHPDKTREIIRDLMVEAHAAWDRVFKNRLNAYFQNVIYRAPVIPDVAPVGKGSTLSGCDVLMQVLVYSQDSAENYVRFLLLNDALFIFECMLDHYLSNPLCIFASATSFQGKHRKETQQQRSVFSGSVSSKPGVGASLPAPSIGRATTSRSAHLISSILKRDSVSSLPSWMKEAFVLLNERDNLISNTYIPPLSRDTLDKKWKNKPFINSSGHLETLLNILGAHVYLCMLMRQKGRALQRFRMVFSFLQCYWMEDPSDNSLSKKEDEGVSFSIVIKKIFLYRLVCSMFNLLISGAGDPDLRLTGRGIGFPSLMNPQRTLSFMEDSAMAFSFSSSIRDGEKGASHTSNFRTNVIASADAQYNRDNGVSYEAGTALSPDYSGEPLEYSFQNVSLSPFVSLDHDFDDGGTGATTISYMNNSFSSSAMLYPIKNPDLNLNLTDLRTMLAYIAHSPLFQQLEGNSEERKVNFVDKMPPLTLPEVNNNVKQGQQPQENQQRSSSNYYSGAQNSSFLFSPSGITVFSDMCITVRELLISMAQLLKGYTSPMADMCSKIVVSAKIMSENKIRKSISSIGVSSQKDSDRTDEILDLLYPPLPSDIKELMNKLIFEVREISSFSLFVSTFIELSMLAAYTSRLSGRMRVAANLMFDVALAIFRLQRQPKKSVRVLEVYVLPYLEQCPWMTLKEACMQLYVECWVAILLSLPHDTIDKRKQNNHIYNNSGHERDEKMSRDYNNPDKQHEHINGKNDNNNNHNFASIELQLLQDIKAKNNYTALFLYTPPDYTPISETVKLPDAIHSLGTVVTYILRLMFIAGSSSLSPLILINIHAWKSVSRLRWEGYEQLLMKFIGNVLCISQSLSNNDGKCMKLINRNHGKLKEEDAKKKIKEHSQLSKNESDDLECMLQLELREFSPWINIGFCSSTTKKKGFKSVNEGLNNNTLSKQGISLRNESYESATTTDCSVNYPPQVSIFYPGMFIEVCLSLVVPFDITKFVKLYTNTDSNEVVSGDERNKSAISTADTDMPSLSLECEIVWEVKQDWEDNSEVALSVVTKNNFSKVSFTPFAGSWINMKKGSNNESNSNTNRVVSTPVIPPILAPYMQTQRVLRHSDNYESNNDRTSVNFSPKMLKNINHYIKKDELGLRISQSGAGILTIVMPLYDGSERDGEYQQHPGEYKLRTIAITLGNVLRLSKVYENEYSADFSFSSMNEDENKGSSIGRFAVLSSQIQCDRAMSDKENKNVFLGNPLNALFSPILFQFINLGSDCKITVSACAEYDGHLFSGSENAILSDVRVRIQRPFHTFLREMMLSLLLIVPDTACFLGVDAKISSYLQKISIKDNQQKICAPTNAPLKQGDNNNCSSDTIISNLTAVAHQQGEPGCSRYKSLSYGTSINGNINGRSLNFFKKLSEWDAYDFGLIGRVVVGSIEFNGGGSVDGHERGGSLLKRMNARLRLQRMNICSSSHDTEIPRVCSISICKDEDGCGECKDIIFQSRLSLLHMKHNPRTTYQYRFDSGSLFNGRRGSRCQKFGCDIFSRDSSVSLYESLLRSRKGSVFDRRTVIGSLNQTCDTGTSMDHYSACLLQDSTGNQSNEVPTFNSTSSQLAVPSFIITAALRGESSGVTVIDQQEQFKVLPSPIGRVAASAASKDNYSGNIVLNTDSYDVPLPEGFLEVTADQLPNGGFVLSLRVKTSEEAHPFSCGQLNKRILNCKTPEDIKEMLTLFETYNTQVWAALKTQLSCEHLTALLAGGLEVALKIPILPQQLFIDNFNKCTRNVNQLSVYMRSLQQQQLLQQQQSIFWCYSGVLSAIFSEPMVTVGRMKRAATKVISKPVVLPFKNAFTTKYEDHLISDCSNNSESFIIFLTVSLTNQLRETSLVIDSVDLVLLDAAEAMFCVVKSSYFSMSSSLAMPSSPNSSSAVVLNATNVTMMHSMVLSQNEKKQQQQVSWGREKSRMRQVLSPQSAFVVIFQLESCPRKGRDATQGVYGVQAVIRYNQLMKNNLKNDNLIKTTKKGSQAGEEAIGDTVSRAAWNIHLSPPGSFTITPSPILDGSVVLVTEE